MPKAAARPAIVPASWREVGVDWAMPLFSTTTSSGRRHSDGEVQRFVDRALAPGAVADVDAGDAHPGAVRLRCSAIPAATGRLSPWTPVERYPVAPDVLAAADPGADRAFPPHDLGEQPVRVAVPGQVVAVAAVVGEDVSRRRAAGR